MDAGSASRCRRTSVEIAERRGHQDVGAAAAADEVARDVLPIAAPCTAPASTRDRRRARRCRRRARAAAARCRRSTRRAAASGRRRRAHARAPDSAASSASSSSRMPSRAAECASTARRARAGTAPGRIRAVEHAEAARPPAAADVDVRASLEQHVDHRAILACRPRSAAPAGRKAARHRVVERRLQLRVRARAPPGRRRHRPPRPASTSSAAGDRSSQARYCVFGAPSMSR